MERIKRFRKGKKGLDTKQKLFMTIVTFCTPGK